MRAQMTLLASALVFAIGWASIRAASALNEAERGDPQCPCTTQQWSASDAIKTELLQIGIDLSQNENYGIGCASHDNVGAQCQTASPPDSCSEKWCYIDTGCMVHSLNSEWWYGRRYSYATCGYLPHPPTDMTGQKLRVVRLSNSGGWKGSYCPGGDAICNGAVARMTSAIVAATNAEITDMAAFNASAPSQNMVTETFGSVVMQAVHRERPGDWNAHWACWYACGMGFVDICMYAGSLKSSRERLARTLHLYSEPVYLVTTAAQTADRFEDHLRSAFDPFRTELWICIVCFVLLIAFVLAWQEHSHSGEYDGMPVLSIVADASYRGLMSFVGGGCLFEPVNLGGRLTAIGFGFFLLTTISAYTANLASILVLKEPLTMAVSSWQDFTDNPGLKLCYDDGIEVWLKKEPWSLPPAKAVMYTSRFDVMENVGITCDAAAVALEDLEEFQSTDSSHCNIVKVGMPMFFVNRVAPVSDRAYDALRFHRTDLQFAWQTTLDRWTPGDICSGSTQQEEEDEDTGMKVQAMIGPFFVASVFCAAGTIVTVASKKSCKPAPSSPSADGDVDDKDNSSSGAQVTRDELSRLMSQYDSKMDQVLAQLQKMNSTAEETRDRKMNGQAVEVHDNFDLRRCLHHVMCGPVERTDIPE